MATKCVVNKPMSKNALFVLAGSAIGTMLLPSNPAVGAIGGGFIVLFALKAM